MPTPDRWQRIEDLYHAALERGRGALDDADPELRREVESLLAQDATGQGLPDEPGIASRLGPYQLEALVGEGGMGKVYRAVDTRLGRAVAVKTSSARFSLRFEREARVIASLNHPNICRLYDVGPNYLVMELIEGPTLTERIARKLSLEEAIGIALQILSALEAAHEKGIVHRDLKPANVRFDGAGAVKVLDFGLAKIEGPAPNADDATRSIAPALTEAGMVMGTLAYMSPEQARAEKVDARTDLFSFGAVLCEMATGRRAFSKPLDWAAPQAGSLPPELRRIVLKLLETDRELRYQTAADVAADLKRLQRAREVNRHPMRWRLGSAAALAAITAAAVAVLYLRPHPAGDRGQWVRLTDFPDSVSQPALSPDGRALTFIRGPETFRGPGQIYVKLLPDGEPVQLTRDNLDKMSPVFSPDGSRIAYTAGGWNTWVLPLVGGQPRLWLKNASGLVWLNRQRLLFSEVKEGAHMGIVSAEESRAAPRDIYLPASKRGMAHRSFPSPDGKSALLVEMDRGSWLPCRLVAIDAASAGRPIGPPNGRCTFAAWSPDGKWMFFSSSAEGNFHIWRQRFPDGEPERITSGPTEEDGLAVFPDGRSFITAVALRQSVVWLREASGERQISLEGYSFDPAFTPDGKRLCYRILKGGLTPYDPGELRIVDLDTGHNEPLLPGLDVVGPPGRAYQISPDGKELLAAVEDRRGRKRIVLAALDRQSPPRQIPGAEGDGPLFGPGGEFFFRVIDGTSAHLYGVRRDGTGLRRVSDLPIILPVGVSPDGLWVVVRKTTPEAPDSVVALPTEGEEAARTIVVHGTSFHVAWSPDGRSIFISVPTSATASHVIGRTFIIPLPPGKMFPKTPEGGFQSEADLAALPGVGIVEAFDTAPGPTPEVYAFSRASVQRNLYRVPLP